MTHREQLCSDSTAAGASAAVARGGRARLCWWVVVGLAVGVMSRLGARADAPAVGHEYHVSPDGRDDQPGTEAQPWRTIARAVRELAAGDTLVLRGGSYCERGIVVGAAGRAGQPITLKNRSGEVPVIDGGFAQFRRAGNSDWVPHDAGRGVYRSRDTFAGAKRVYGVLGPGDGGHALVPYETYAALSSDREDYSASEPFYVGPGVFWNGDDAHVYVRLAASRYHARLGCAAPGSLDPRRTPMVLCGDDTVLQFAGTAAFHVLAGITVRHGATAVEFTAGCHHVTMQGCELGAGRYAVLARDRVHDLTFDAVDVHGHFPPYVARSDVKRPEGGPPAHLLQGSAFQLEGGIDRVEIRNGTFTALFDAIDTTDVPTGFDIHHNVFRTIRDDVFEIATAGHHVNFHHNTVTEAAAGVSWNGSVAPPPASAGTKYVHHNVIDTSHTLLYGRDDPQRLLPAAWRGPNGDGMASGRAFASHDTSELAGPDPWKIYHNTIVGGADVDGGGLGLSYRYPGFDPAVPHEVVNNILVQTGGQCVVENARVADGSQLFDGNLYHRSHADASEPLWASCPDGEHSASFARLADFLASRHWQSSRAHYAPGWEAAGVEADPQLDAEHRPASGGPASRGALDLSARGWPDAAPVPYRGARSPK